MAPQRAFVRPLRRWDPEQIDGYVLIGRLGAGAMGQVYLGRSAAGRLVAVKTIKIELAEEPDFRNRFAQEVAAARRVSGAFTAAVVAADPEADLPWLATAYVPAPSLSTLIRAEGPLPAQAVRWLGAGCAEALESIHNAGLVHRDLKPSNVLVSPDGPRVIDFGIARAAERVQLTVTRGAVGTPAYMAPEQARDTRQATMASDIFSLGATLLFAATGHAPYQGETVMDLLVRLATEPPDLSGLPQELAGIVSGCLQRDPRKRPDSAAVLAHLAPGTGLADVAELGQSALPASALVLIDAYRSDPLPMPPGPAEGGAAGSSLAGGFTGSGGARGGPAAGSQAHGSSAGDDTFGSHAGLSLMGGAETGWTSDARTGSAATGSAEPASAGTGGAGAGSAVTGRAGTGRAGTGGAGTGSAGMDSAGTDSARTGGAATGRRRPRQALVMAAGIAVVIAASAAAGAGIADSQRSTPAAANNAADQNPAGSQAPAGNPPPGPPPTGLPTPATRPGGSSTPSIGVNQPTGDGLTGFVISGWGWPPEQPLNITLDGTGTSHVHPPADGAGNFNYTINQDHEFFRGAIPPGLYRVTVTAGNGKHASLTFRVDPIPGQAPPSA